MFYILISILTGVIIVISRVLNTKLSQKIGLLESSYFNYFTGTLASIALFLIVNEEFSLSSFKQGVPLYAYFGGFLGILVVILNSIVTPKMSSFYVTLFIFVAQLFTGIIIDFIISRNLPFNKILGGLLVVLGLAYNIYTDYRK